MAKDRDNDLSGSSHQSKRPALNHFDSSSEQLHPTQQHHRPKPQKHVVGGGGRLHARIPSSKALHKSHATASTAKLNRRRSNSPDHQGADPPFTATHRRATSDPRLDDKGSSSNLKKNLSQTSLKRNRSHVDVASKKTKSALNLKRSQSNPAVHKLKTSGGSKVHFDFGDDEPEAFVQDEGPEDEWVDASNSASPLLSRRSSVAAGAQITETTEDPRGSPSLSHEIEANRVGSPNGANSPSQDFNRGLASHKQQYLTSRLLQRTPSHGAPPMMSTESVSVRPNPSRPTSPSPGTGRDASIRTEAMSQPRPGSSGNHEELTSRFVGHNSQEPGSEIPIDSFLHAINHGGISRAAVNGRLDANGPRRPQSMGNLAQARGQRRHSASGLRPNDDEAPHAQEDGDAPTPAPRARRNGGYVVPTDMSRTQQKLNLQRASSSLETGHLHPGLGIGLGGVPVTAGPLGGASSYDSRDPRIGKILERTGMEYLVVRRYQNPIARSLTRLSQLPGADKNRPIPRPGTRPSTAYSQRRTEPNGGRSGPSSLREREPSVVTLIGGQSARRPGTPRSTYSSRHMHTISNSSSLDTEDDISRIHERQRLSGSSLVNGEEDAATIAILRQMWDKNLELSASQD